MLKVLPANIANLIAAGEVVQRPASVVKELVENAIDAGSTNITILVEDAGKTLIRVLDDGCGMTPDDAVLCFERHATSKITAAEDLSGILTYGFRGEALPSIAAVAEVTLRTRAKGQPTGTEVVFTPSGLLSRDEAAMPEGTDIAVRNLFYSLPARRKFLKSENAELRHIIAEFSHVALCHPEVGIRISHNRKDIYNLKKANTLKQRIIEIEGKDMGKELIDIKTDTNIISIHGFVGNPPDARKTAGNQYFFVNGRYFRSPYLHKAVMKAYDKLIPDGSYPSYYLYFTIAPEDVDVNIHPAKTEVKFENESEIFELLTAVIKESLGRYSFIPLIDFDHDTLPDFTFPTEVPSGGSPRTSAEAHTEFDYIRSAGTAGSSGSAGFAGAGRGGSSWSGASAQHSSQYAAQRPKEDYGALFETTAVQSPGILQISDRYLATPMRSGLMIVDIGRARERIFYERYLSRLDNSATVSHQVLFPCHIQVTAQEYLLLTGDSRKLQEMGFYLEGEQTEEGGYIIGVKGLPEGMGDGQEAVRAAIDSLLALLKEETVGLAKASDREAIARKLALSSAISARKERLSPDGARLLVDTLFSCAEPETSPSGRRCMMILTEDDIEKQL